MSEEKKPLTNEEYKFIYERVVRLCLDFIVIKNGKILLSKRDIDPYKGYWHLPGGMVYKKETIDQAAERILKGELGVKPEEKKLVGYMECPDEINKDGINIHSISMAFFTILEEGKIKGGDQAHEIEFFELLPEKVHPIHGKFLKDNWKTIIR